MIDGLPNVASKDGPGIDGAECRAERLVVRCKGVSLVEPGNSLATTQIFEEGLDRNYLLERDILEVFFCLMNSACHGWLTFLVAQAVHRYVSAVLFDKISQKRCCLERVCTLR
jgi:hypothetical protein